MSLSTDGTGRVSTHQTYEDLHMHMPTSSPDQDTNYHHRSKSARASSIARAGPFLRRSNSAIFNSSVSPEDNNAQSFPRPPTSEDEADVKTETDASVPRKDSLIVDGEHSPGSDAKSVLQRKRQRMHQQVYEHDSSADPRYMHRNYSLNLQIPHSNPFDFACSDEPTSATSSTGGLSELLKAATTKGSSPAEPDSHLALHPHSSQGSSEAETDSDIAAEARARGGDQTYSSVGSSPSDERTTPDLPLEMPSRPQLVRPAIIATEVSLGSGPGEKGSDSECAKLLLSLSGGAC